MNRLDSRRSDWRDGDNKDDVQAFQERHERFSDRVERLLMQLVILGLVALVLVQTLHMNTAFRKLANTVEALEGVPWSQVTEWATGEPFSLTVTLMSRRSAPEAKLMVDGKVIGAFTTASVTARVRPGQVVTVDGTRSPQTLTFRVVGAAGLANPALGTSVTTLGNQQNMGVVKRPQ